MGSVERRLRQLESLRRAEAVAEIAAIYEQLTDEEIALMITGMEAVRKGFEPTAEEVAVGRRLDEMEDEEVIAAAIGLEEGMSEEEVSGRISALAKELGPWERRKQGIVRHLTAIRRERYALEKAT